jgi:hypothetical protein
MVCTLWASQHPVENEKNGNLLLMTMMTGLGGGGDLNSLLTLNSPSFHVHGWGRPCFLFV